MTAPKTPRFPFRPATPGDYRQEKRLRRRRASAVYLAKLIAAIVIPAALPALPWHALPTKYPEPKAPQSLEQPAYENELAEPAEGLADLGRRPKG